MEWRQEQVRWLIGAFHEHPELWDPARPDFKDRTKKHRSWREIDEELGVERGEGEKKMRMLVSQFNRECKKTVRTGRAAKWAYFRELSFLQERRPRPSNGPDTSLSDMEDCCPVVISDAELSETANLVTQNINSNYDQEDENGKDGKPSETEPLVQVLTTQPKGEPQYSEIDTDKTRTLDLDDVNWNENEKRKQKRTEENQETGSWKRLCGEFYDRNFFRNGNRRGSEDQNHLDAFGSYVSSKMRVLSERQRVLAEKVINEALFKAQLGGLTINSCVRNGNG